MEACYNADKQLDLSGTNSIYYQPLQIAEVPPVNPQLPTVSQVISLLMDSACPLVLNPASQVQPDDQPMPGVFVFRRKQ